MQVQGRRYFGGEHLLRKGRHSEAGQVYLITTNTEDRRPLFANLASGRLVVQALRYADEQRWSHTLAFVVMPDHLHWLVRLGPRRTLSALVASIKGASARVIHQQGQFMGPVWQEGFHDRAVRKEQDLRALARYVVANPLRAGLVRDMGQYPHWDAVWLEPEGSALDILEG